MRNRLFDKHYTMASETAVSENIKNAYDELLDMAIAQLSDVDMLAEDAEQQLKNIKNQTVLECKRLSTAMKTNMPKQLCEDALLNALEEAIANTKAGKLND